MNRKSTFLLFALLFAMDANGAENISIEWAQAPSVPDPIGFAGSFAGVSQDTLLVAGGANFPDRPPWQGGTKVWHDQVFALESADGAWKPVGRLPRPNGYGVSINVSDGFVLIGGGDAKQHFTDVWLVRYASGRVSFTSWPSLPVPLAMAAGALVNRAIYVAGGIDRPDATTAQREVYALDLDHLDAGWRKIETPPAPGRILAVAGAYRDAFFLFAGSDLTADAQGKAKRIRLRDAWSFTPGTGWRRLADLPQIVVAAPSPASTLGDSLLVLGGDDGVHVVTPPDKHPGFSRRTLAYSVPNNSWSDAGDLPFSLVTTTSVCWQNRIVVPAAKRGRACARRRCGSAIFADASPRTAALPLS